MKLLMEVCFFSILLVMNKLDDSLVMAHLSSFDEGSESNEYLNKREDARKSKAQFVITPVLRRRPEITVNNHG